MTNIYKGGTNGGANRFFLQDGEVKVAGESAKGREVVDLEVLERIWDFETVRTGTLEADFSADNIRVFETQAGDWRVQLGPENVGGSFVFDFGDGKGAEKGANQFVTFVEKLLDFDAFDFIDAAGADASKITNLEDATDNVGLTVTNDDEVRFSGEGVSGNTKTDAFDSAAAAQEFIDDLQSFQTGLLDEVLV